MALKHQMQIQEGPLRFDASPDALTEFTENYYIHGYSLL